MIILNYLPMPPRLSDCYARHRRMFKTKELKAYEKEMLDYWKQNLSVIRKAKLELKSGPQSPLRVDRYFVFPPHEIFTKKDTVKMMDTTNRIKAFDDAIANLLQIDDRYFFAGDTQKIVGLEGSLGYVIAKIQKCEVRGVWSL